VFLVKLGADEKSFAATSWISFTGVRWSDQFWTIDYRGEVYHLRDSKGLLYLTHLLTNLGKDFRALELCRSTVAQAT
jgi:hypothetical protein